MKMRNFILFLLFSLCCVTIIAQKKNPRGLYRLSLVEHEDGSMVYPPFIQYKYINNNCSFTINDHQPGSYSFMILEPTTLNYTGNVLVGAEGNGIRIYDSSSKAFKLCWYNTNVTQENPFRFLQFNTEHYVTDSLSSDIKEIVNILTNSKKSMGKCKEVGWWSLVGSTELDRYDTLVGAPNPMYFYYDGQRFTSFTILPGNPSKPSFIAVAPRTYEIKDNILYFDSVSVPIEFIDSDKMIYAEQPRSYLQRSGMPLPLQSLLGTKNPVSDYKGTLLPNLQVACQPLVNAAREMDEHHRKKDYVKYIQIYCNVLMYAKQMEVYNSILPNICNEIPIISKIQELIDGLADHGNSLAYEEAENENYEDALKILSMVLRLCPDEANLYDSCGEMFLRLGKTDEAVECYKTVLEKDPDFFQKHTQSVLLMELQEKGLIGNE